MRRYNSNIIFEIYLWPCCQHLWWMDQTSDLARGVLPCIDPSSQESVAVITATHVVRETQLHFPALSRHYHPHIKRTERKKEKYAPSRKPSLKASNARLSRDWLGNGLQIQIKRVLQLFVSG